MKKTKKQAKKPRAYRKGLENATFDKKAKAKALNELNKIAREMGIRY